MSNFIPMCCGVCKVQWGMDRSFYDTMQKGAGRLTFFCPNGHERTFIKGETDEDKLRREVNSLRQNAAYLEDARRRAEEMADFRRRQVSAAKGQITKLKKRAANGVCPCCNRAFSDLQRHMSTKHPTFISEPDASEHVH